MGDAVWTQQSLIGGSRGETAFGVGGYTDGKQTHGLASVADIDRFPAALAKVGKRWLGGATQRRTEIIRYIDGDCQSDVTQRVQDKPSIRAQFARRSERITTKCHADARHLVITQTALD